MSSLRARAWRRVLVCGLLVLAACGGGADTAADSTTVPGDEQEPAVAAIEVPDDGDLGADSTVSGSDATSVVGPPFCGATMALFESPAFGGLDAFVAELEPWAASDPPAEIADDVRASAEGMAFLVDQYELAYSDSGLDPEGQAEIQADLTARVEQRILADTDSDGEITAEAREAALRTYGFTPWMVELRQTVVDWLEANCEGGIPAAGPDAESSDITVP